MEAVYEIRDVKLPVSGFYFIIVIIPKMINTRRVVRREKLSKPFWVSNNLFGTDFTVLLSLFGL